jgi:MFS family permease
MAKGRTYRTDQKWSLNEALRTKVLWLMLVLFIAQMMPVFMMTTHGVLHFLDHDYSRMQSASILSVILLGSGIARFPMGWLGDRIEPRRIVIASMILRLAAFIGLWLAPSLAALIVCGFLFGFSYGTTIVMIPTIMANYFGPSAFATINGVLAPIMIVFGAAVPVGAGYIADHYASYDLAFITLVCLIGAALLCAYLLSPPYKSERQTMEHVGKASM